MGAPPPQYEPIVTEGNEALVHHMEVFQCAAEVESVPHFSGPCDSKMKPERLNYCRHVLAAWALGAKVRALPASPQGAPRVSTGGSLGGPQRAPLPTASMLLGSHGSLEPQMPPHPPCRSSWASFSFPVKFRWIWRGPCTGWSRGWPPWLRPGSSRSSAVGLGRWARLGVRALHTR